MSSGAVRVPWRPVEPLSELNGDLGQVLSSVDSLRAAWVDAIALATPEEFEEARRRSLRRHAIETGIIERLYDVDWGVTEALVAEGLAAEVAAREGGIDEDALATIRSQYDALQFVAETAREVQQPLTLHFIRQLHSYLCRRQLVYEAQNELGQVLQVPLQHGSWKQHANHVLRPDGTLLEYVPPEHVQSEMERLLSLNDEAAEAHPVVRAAWLHHSFIRIHPFADGNGRVARALTMLVLLQAKYAPLVVDRRTRADYIDALDKANDGELRDLARLFARLEIVALRAELERPARPEIALAGAVNVARAYAQRLSTISAKRDAEKAARTQELAESLHLRITAHLDHLGQAVREQFVTEKIPASMNVFSAGPPEAEARWWRAQIIRAAKRAGFFVSLEDGTWWTNLRLTVIDQTLRYVAVIQKVGHGETGVLALTAFAEGIPTHDQSDESSRPLYVPLLESRDAESATFVYNEDVNERWSEVCEILDRSLAAAVAKFSEGLS